MPARKVQVHPPVRRKKPAPKRVDVTVTVKMVEKDIQTALAETIIDTLYNSLNRGYGNNKPAVKITVAGKDVT